ncbi:MAG: CpaF family protein [Deltaproteobacteria bacterium]|nr:CpaF family protein [Deltaproteobacteria bacterium]
MKQQLEPIAYDVISRSRSFPGSTASLDQLVQRVLDATLGLGPLEDLLADPTITEIMVNGHQQIYAERSGRLERVTAMFADERELRAVIERIIAPIGRRIDESSPLVDARLPDGSRVNAIIPPLALNGPILTIRRFDQRMKSMRDLVAAGMLTDDIAAFLATKVCERSNIIISGGTGSGKTTFLNALSENISPEERIITIEDAAELQLRQAHVVRLETRPPNLEGAGAVTIRDLVRNSLRMRPDRIVVGEVRGAEAFDMLQAMNTGHDGSLTTVHANAAADALRRIEVMVLSAHDLPLHVIREQIVSAIDLVIHLARCSNGQRQVVEVVELEGMVGETISLRRCP